MNSGRFMPWVSLTMRLSIGSLFIIAGLAKIADPVGFFATLMGFRLFPDLVLPLLAIFLPWLEFLLGLCVLLGIAHRTASLLLAGLNVFFAAAILSLVARGIEIDCGCFGLLADILHIPDAADMTAVMRDLVFAGMCIPVFRSGQTVFSLESYFKVR